MSNYKVGDIVKFINTGRIYPYAIEYASRLNLSNWISGELSNSRLFECFKVVSVTTHPDADELFVLGIEDIFGRQYIIDTFGGVENMTPPAEKEDKVVKITIIETYASGSVMEKSYGVL